MKTFKQHVEAFQKITVKDMKLGKWADTSKVVRSLKAISKLPDFGQGSLKRR